MIYTVSNNNTQLEWGITGEERIVQNVSNLIRTKKYEVPFMRNVGIDPDIVDNPAPIIKAMLYDDIVEMIETYESRAKVVEILFADIDENGNLEYEIRIEV